MFGKDEGGGELRGRALCLGVWGCAPTSSNSGGIVLQLPCLPVCECRTFALLATFILWPGCGGIAGERAANEGNPLPVCCMASPSARIMARAGRGPLYLYRALTWRPLSNATEISAKSEGGGLPKNSPRDLRPLERSERPSELAEDHGRGFTHFYPQRGPPGVHRPGDGLQDVNGGALRLLQVERWPAAEDQRAGLIFCKISRWKEGPSTSPLNPSRAAMMKSI